MNHALKTWPISLGHRPEAAFTLLELLIAVAISAIVLASISTLFFGALHLRAKAAEAAEQTLPTDRAVAIMKRDLRASVPPGVLAGPMGTDAIAVGMVQQPMLELFTASGSVTADLPWSGVQKIDYSLQSSGNQNKNAAGRDLIRGVTRNLLASSPASPDPQTLLENVRNLQFSFYDGTNWNDIWSTTLSNLPIAIKVSIDFAVSGTAQVQPSVQFLVPIVSWGNTNSITNQLSN